VSANTIDMPTEALSLKGERILLVGGAGFIGHHLALALRRAGAEVMVADSVLINNLVSLVVRRDIDPVRRALYQGFVLERFALMRDADVDMRVVDARNMYELSEVFNEFMPTKAVHLAAISSAVTANKAPALAYDLQITSLRNLLELCRLRQSETGQVVFFSSSTVYGDFENDWVDETVRPRPRGVYANAKYIGERMMREHERLYGIPYTIVRPSALYGIRCISQRVTQKFVENALMGKPSRLEGGGSGLLDFTHIDDLTDGLVRSMALPGGLSRTFNLTYGAARPVSELAAIIRDRFPDARFEEAPAAKEKPKRGTLRIDRAREFLGFTPKRDLSVGYAAYCDWYKAQWEKTAASLGQG